MTERIVLIVGHGSGVGSATLNGRIARVQEQGVEVIQCEQTDMSAFLPEPIIISARPLFEDLTKFYPRAKHSKKSHQQKYKYHK